jgi:hypothetical protein
VTRLLPEGGSQRLHRIHITQKQIIKMEGVSRALLKPNSSSGSLAQGLQLPQGRSDLKMQQKLTKSPI